MWWDVIFISIVKKIEDAFKYFLFIFLRETAERQQMYRLMISHSHRLQTLVSEETQVHSQSAEPLGAGHGGCCML